jgi:hypothetical protein
VSDDITEDQLAGLANPFPFLVARFQRDPVCKILGCEPDPWQYQVLVALQRGHRRISIRLGHGVGKSCLLARALLWFALTRFPFKAVVTAPSAPQLYDALLRAVRRDQSLVRQAAQAVAQAQGVSRRGVHQRHIARRSARSAPGTSIRIRDPFRRRRDLPHEESLPTPNRASPRRTSDPGVEAAQNGANPRSFRTLGHAPTLFGHSIRHGSSGLAPWAVAPRHRALRCRPAIPRSRWTSASIKPASRSYPSAITRQASCWSSSASRAAHRRQSSARRR